MTQEITAYTAALRSISSAAKRKAKKHNLPVIIHNRNSKDDIFQVLQETNFKNFVLHWYTENLEFAQKLIDFSPHCKISFS